MKKLLYIFAGGFFGALLRNIFFNISFLANFQAFALNTIIVNLIGCFLLSTLIHLAEKSIKLDEKLHTAITTGFLGAFTTFSTFSKNLADLLYSSHFIEAGIYLSISIIGGLYFVYLGYLFSNQIYSKIIKKI